MLTKRLFVISIVVLSFANCKKKDSPSFQIEVKAVDTNTGLPISNVSVDLLSKSLNGSTYSTAFKLIESQISDSEGISNFDTEYSTIIEFQINTEVDNYFQFSKSINPDDLHKDEKNDILIQLQSTAEINISIKNQFPLNAQDELVYNSTIQNCNSCIQVPYLVLSGMQIDTNFNGLVLGNQYFKYNYITTKNNITTQYTDSTYCSAGSQVNILINF